MKEKRIRSFDRASARQRGIHMAELAIVTPVFLMLLAAAAEFGSYFYIYQTLTKATHIGARYLASKPYTDAEKATARNLVACGSTQSCTTGIAKGLSTANVQITQTGTATQPELITVQIVNYNYTPVFNLAKWMKSGTWSSIPVKPSTTMRYMLER